jgi:adenylyl- and sulfurtransferase ThiI
MTDIERQVAAVKADIAAAQAARARAQHEQEVAKAQAEAVVRDLKDEFGVSSVQEAGELAAKLEAELAAECSLVRDALDRAGKGNS